MKKPLKETEVSSKRGRPKKIAGTPEVKASPKKSAKILKHFKKVLKQTNEFLFNKKGDVIGVQTIRYF